MDLRQCEEKLQLLMQKYGVEVPFCPKLKEQDGCYYLEEPDASVPLLIWRQERRFAEMRGLKDSGRAGMPSVLRSERLVGAEHPLTAELIRELDLCEWLMGSPIRSVCAFRGGPALNLIATLENDVVCTVELAAALEGGVPLIDRHEITTRRGVICDRVVDTQIPQSSVYVFTAQQRQEFNDQDFELYGLPPEHVSLVREAFAVLCDSLEQDRTDTFARLQELAALVGRSAQQERCLTV